MVDDCNSKRKRLQRRTATEITEQRVTIRNSPRKLVANKLPRDEFPERRRGAHESLVFCFGLLGLTISQPLESSAGGSINSVRWVGAGVERRAGGQQLRGRALQNNSKHNVTIMVIMMY
jgi:hypothetical protein